MTCGTIQIFLISVCLHQSHFSSAKFLFKKNCDYLNPHGTNLYQQSKDTCKHQCEIRSWCKSVHYFKVQGKCALLSSNGDVPGTDGTRSCIHISKGDMNYANQSICPCWEHQVCDPVRGVCSISICPVYDVPMHAEALGNMRQVGSRVKVKCNGRYGERLHRDGVICQSGGTWDPLLTCILVHCEEPPAVVNTVLTRGSTRFGSTRTYQCAAGYSVDGKPGTTAYHVICSYGIWTRNPEWTSCIEITPTIGTGCSGSNQCFEAESMCMYGKCFCSPMYRYNSTLKNCVKVCTQITDGFTLYAQSSISSGYMNNVALVAFDCRQICLIEPRCMAYESVILGVVCSFAYVSVEMIIDADPQAFKQDLLFNLHSRDCV